MIRQEYSMKATSWTNNNSIRAHTQAKFINSI